MESEVEECAQEVKSSPAPVNLLAFGNIGRVIVAEDQAINLHLLRDQFAELKLCDKTTFCRDGQEAIDSVFALLTSREDGTV